MDTMLIAEMVDGVSLADRETAIDEVLELGGAIDGLLQQQIGMNIDALDVSTGRVFTEAAPTEIAAATLKVCAIPSWSRAWSTRRSSSSSKRSALMVRQRSAALRKRSPPSTVHLD